MKKLEKEMMVILERLGRSDITTENSYWPDDAYKELLPLFSKTLDDVIGEERDEWLREAHEQQHGDHEMHIGLDFYENKLKQHRARKKELGL